MHDLIKTLKIKEKVTENNYITKIWNCFSQNISKTKLAVHSIRYFTNFMFLILHTVYFVHLEAIGKHPVKIMSLDSYSVIPHKDKLLLRLSKFPSNLTCFLLINMKYNLILCFILNILQTYPHITCIFKSFVF